MRQLLLLVAILVSIESCHENPEPLTPEDFGYWGTCTVDENGWTNNLEPYATKPYGQNFTISLDSLDANLSPRTNISIIKVPLKVGTFRLANTSYQVSDGLIGATFFINEQDILRGYYNVLEADSSSFLTLLSVDTVSKEIKGKFDITFIVDHRPDPSYPDTIRFRNGVFHTRLRN